MPECSACKKGHVDQSHADVCCICPVCIRPVTRNSMTAAYERVVHNKCWLVMNGKTPAFNTVEYHVAQLKLLTDEERKDIFREFCTSCGSIDSGCQCWNDD